MNDTTPPPERPEATVPQPGLRFLEIAVYIMGGLLVLMLVVLLGGIAWKIANRGEAPPVEPKEMTLNIPAGASVSGMTLDGDRLAVNTGKEIVVFDVKKGQVLARIKLAGP
ncbi:MAG: hypothetical protein HC855_08825 [Rhizobiales bacterium]|nr:hypothetical protein [Hyphomicrobiales bacterium]